MCRLISYFEADRFSTLGDAYNYYEEEVDRKKIIANLDEALRLLNQIKNNQFLLYSALTEINKNVERANKKLDSCVNNLNRSAYAAEMSAVCLGQVAYATTLLSQIEYYKNRHGLPAHVRGLASDLSAYDSRLTLRAGIK